MVLACGPFSAVLFALSRSTRPAGSSRLLPLPARRTDTDFVGRFEPRSRFGRKGMITKHLCVSLAAGFAFAGAETSAQTLSVVQPTSHFVSRPLSEIHSGNAP